VRSRPWDWLALALVLVGTAAIRLRVAVIGSEPQISYSGRRSVTGYIYTDLLVELQPYASAIRSDVWLMVFERGRKS
jgi:hypothetical protein